MKVVDHDSPEDAEVFEGMFSKGVLYKEKWVAPLLLPSGSSE